ncbi:MAG: BatA domain-containing protein [Bacteroidales bacterium]|nr:BatA domain-containing protein [Bacteroidales bacterium]
MTFAQPAFLWGLLALAIPIAVHLFNFRRYRKVMFSNVDRLEALQSESHRHNELRRWLVLAARLVAVAALVLAFARPTLPAKGSQLASGSTAVSLYIDNSFSMDAQGTAGSLLDEARGKAREIAAAYGPATRFQLCTSDLTGDQFQWLDREELDLALDALQISPASIPLATAAARQQDFLRHSGAPNRHAYILSDFQRSHGNPALLPADSLAAITLIPLQGASADNLYIDTLRLDAPAYFVGGTVAVEASVRNSGAHQAEKIPVKLLVNGRERALATLDIPAGASAKALLQFTIDSAGWLDGTVEITDYPITYDDRYHFSLLAGQPVRMLDAADRQPNASLKRLFEDDDAVVYSAAALPPDLAGLHFIVLDAPASLPSGQAQALAQWVEEGGTLAVIPPPDAAVEPLNTLLAMLHAPTLGPWVAQPLKASVVDFHAALYRNVFSATDSEMELPSVQGRYRLATAQAVSQPIITLADGSPLLSCTPCGLGHLYLFATPLTADWTDLPSQALFVPTLYNMALYSRPQPAVAHTLGSAEPIALQGRYALDRQPPALERDGQSPTIPEIRSLGSRSVMVPHGEVAADGHYRLADEHLAFNYNRMESELDFYAPDEVAGAVEHLSGYSVIRHTSKPLDQELRDRTGGRPLWRWCLLLALLALAAETLFIKLPWSSK